MTALQIQIAELKSEIIDLEILQEIEDTEVLEDYTDEDFEL